MSRFTLNDLEHLTGIKTDTLRIWERRYNILSPNRTHTNRRWYEDDDLKKLINISLLYNNGVKISVIAGMSDIEIAEKASTLSESLKTSDNIISTLVLAVNDLDENAINEIFLRSVILRGFEKTFTEVLFPFIRKVGIMWHTGAMDPHTEHFISAILRQRLIASIDSMPQSLHEKSKRVMMYLPEGEFHELGLLYFYYIVKKRGHRILYLGQATPFDSVKQSAAAWRPDIIITGLQTELNISDPNEFLRNLSAVHGKPVIYVGGALASHAENLKLINIKPLTSEEDLDFLSS
ncbi:MAG: MerR family transcriptional regulator [Bacteroidetes bacterium]|nr:MerR family transcriptional regulator [Bacteroidota bacterium]